MDEYCNKCGAENVSLLKGQNGLTICENCSFEELQSEFDEYELVHSIRMRIGKE